MRFLWIAARKDLAWLRRDPFSSLSWLGIPLCIGLLIHFVFGGGEPAPQGRLLIADRDNTIASSLIAGQFSRGPLGRMFVVEKVSEENGRARIGRGDASAFLLIPPGLQDAYLNNQPFRLLLLTNPRQTILPNIAAETLSMTLDGAFYLRRAAGTEPRNLANAGAIAARLSETPPLIQLQSTVLADKRVNRDAAAFFFTSMLFMALLLMANSLAGDMWRERTAGTLRRLVTTPASIAGFLGGRLVTVLLLYAAVSLTGVAVARWLANAQVASLATATAWAALSGTAFYLLLLLVALGSSSRRAANVWGNILVFPLSFLGGCFFPFAVMPAWMAGIGKLTPNGWAVLHFQNILAGSTTAPQFLAATAVAVTVSGLAFLVALRQLRRGAAA